MYNFVAYLMIIAVNTFNNGLVNDGNCSSVSGARSEKRTRVTLDSSALDSEAKKIKKQELKDEAEKEKENETDKDKGKKGEKISLIFILTTTD